MNHLFPYNGLNLWFRATPAILSVAICFEACAADQPPNATAKKD
jgi:hypothetical protein